MSTWPTYTLLLTVWNFQIKIIEKACFLLTCAAIPRTSENTWAIFPKEHTSPFVHLWVMSDLLANSSSSFDLLSLDGKLATVNKSYVGR